MKLVAPGPGGIYFGAYSTTLEVGYEPRPSANDSCPPDPPGQPVNEKDCDLTVHTKQAMESFLCAVSSEEESFRPAIVHFWNDWSPGTACRRFPQEVVRWIEGFEDESGPAPVPYISLNTRSHMRNYFVDAEFSLDSIIRGEWDEELKQWGDAAATYGKPLMVTWAPECNGEFKPHNAVHHGGPLETVTAVPSRQGEHPHDSKAMSGIDRFKSAYRKVVDTIRSAGADNIQWVLHLVAGDSGAPWNKMEAYYPGHKYVDWFGLSVYGAQDPDPSVTAVPFYDLFNDAYWRIQEMDRDEEGTYLDTPVIITEMGCAMALSRDPKTPDRASDWANEAFQHIMTGADGAWSNLKAFSWWNESWLNTGTDDPDWDIKRSIMRVQENPALAEVFHDRLREMRERGQLLEAPIIETG